MTTYPTWRKASYSSNQGNCVELAALDERTAGIRDSKDPGAGHLTFTRAQLAELIATARGGGYDHLL
jgi:hypothetical protein